MDCPAELIDRMSVALLATPTPIDIFVSRILSPIRQMAPFFKKQNSIASFWHLKRFSFARLGNCGGFELIKIKFAVNQGQSGDFSKGVGPLAGNGFPSHESKITSFFHFVFGRLWLN